MATSEGRYSMEEVMRPPLKMHGNLQVGGVEPLPGLVPTPRFDGENCYLPPRQHAYGFGEVELHSPDYRARMAAFAPTHHGPGCPNCGSRFTKRGTFTDGTRYCMGCRRVFDMRSWLEHVWGKR